MNRVLLAAVAAALLAGFALGSCGQRTPDDLAWHERNVATVTRTYHRTRDSIPVLQAASAKAERKRLTMRDTGVAVLARGDSVVADIRRNLSADTATVPTLRADLTLALASYDSLAAAFRAYLRADAVAHTASDAVLAQYGRTVAAADSTITAQRAHIAALQARECRVLGLPCLSRRAAFVGGVIVTLGVITGVMR